jgi:hypothetical protein
MPHYRVYQLDSCGHIDRPPDLVDCEDDETAIAIAEQLVDGRDVELWQLDRLVVRFSPRTLTPPTARDRAGEAAFGFRVVFPLDMSLTP